MRTTNSPLSCHFLAAQPSPFSPWESVTSTALSWELAGGGRCFQLLLVLRSLGRGDCRSDGWFFEEIEKYMVVVLVVEHQKQINKIVFLIAVN